MSIPIRINPFFWLIAAFISWSVTFDFVGMFLVMPIIFFSVLIHEYGHALTAVYFKQNAEITLTGWGGVTKRSGSKLKFWQEFLVILNGPLMSFALYFLSAQLISHYPQYLNAFTLNMLNITMVLNLLWTVLNLVPIQPLDGGRLLKVILEVILGVKGIKISAILSFIFSVGFGLFFVTLGKSMLTSAIFFLLAYENYIYWKSVSDMSQEDQNEKSWSELSAAEHSLKSGDYEKSWEILSQLKNQSHKGIVYVVTLQLMANILYIQHKYQEAYVLIAPILGQIKPEFFKLAQQIAYRAGDINQSIELGKKAFQEFPDYEVALLNALSHAAKAETIPTIGWLKLVRDKGYPEFLNLIQSKEFDFVRQDPSFQKLINTIYQK